MEEHQKENGMSDKEYNKIKKEFRKQQIQKNKELRADKVIEMHTPRWLVSNKIDAKVVNARRKIRRGIYCKTCKLMLKLDNYMMNLFRDAAEGRAPGFFFR
jgi:hypothetical protein